MESEFHGSNLPYKTLIKNRQRLECVKYAKQWKRASLMAQICGEELGMHILTEHLWAKKQYRCEQCKMKGAQKFD